jgi:hypothetical protein
MGEAHEPRSGCPINATIEVFDLTVINAGAVQGNHRNAAAVLVEMDPCLVDLALHISTVMSTADAGPCPEGRLRIDG